MNGSARRYDWSIPSNLTPGTTYSIQVNDGYEYVYSGQFTLQQGPTVPVTGLKLWLRADRGVVSSGGQVSSWQDQSGNNNTAVMPTAGRQPYYVTGALNGQPVLRFNGAQSLGLTNILQLTQTTLFVVAKNTRVPAYGFGMILGPANTSPNHQLRFNGDSCVLLVTPNIYSSCGGYTGVYHALSVRYDGATRSVYRDGSLVSNFSDSSTSAWQLYQVGAWFSSYFLEGDIAEIIVYNRALSESERTAVNAYLRGKYALP